MNAKQGEHHRPQFRSNRTMDKKMSTDSPLLLHIKHQSQIQIFSFRKISIVNIFPKAMIKKKKVTLEGTLGFQIDF